MTFDPLFIYGREGDELDDLIMERLLDARSAGTTIVEIGLQQYVEVWAEKLMRSVSALHLAERIVLLGVTRRDDVTLALQIRLADEDAVYELVASGANETRDI